jgi:hypothetical protein
MFKTILLLRLAAPASLLALGRCLCRADRDEARLQWSRDTYIPVSPFFESPPSSLTERLQSSDFWNDSEIC